MGCLDKIVSIKTETEMADQHQHTTTSVDTSIDRTGAVTAGSDDAAEEKRRKKKEKAARQKANKAAAASRTTAAVGGDGESGTTDEDFKDASAAELAAAMAALNPTTTDGSPSLAQLVAANAATAAGSDAAEPDHPCPVCFVAEDTATVDGVGCGQCFKCGQLYCGGCAGELETTFACCPVCQ
jgi:hypothetical protein